MFDIARNTIKALGRGEYVPAVFGSDRPIMRDSLIAVLRGIEPTSGERVKAAFGYGPVARIRAYDAGVKYLASAYNTVLA